MKIKALIFILVCSFLRANGANDTTIVYKVLPPFFCDIFSSCATGFNIAAVSHAYYSRDQLMEYYKNDAEKLLLITNYFSLEDDYVRLNSNSIGKVFFYIYVESNWKKDFEYSYLDVYDKISFTCPPNIDNSSIIKLIGLGLLTQNKPIPKFALRFTKPKGVECYYPVLAENENYKITIEDYEYLRKNGEIKDECKPRGTDPLVIPAEKHDNSLIRSIIEKQPDTLPSEIGKEWADSETGGAMGPKNTFVTGRMAAKMPKILLDTLVENMQELINTYRYFLKYNLPKNVMFRTLPKSEAIFHESQRFVQFADLSAKALRKYKTYIEFDENCKTFNACIYNASIEEEIGRTKGIIGGQGGYGRLLQSVDEIRIIYIKEDFLETTPWNLDFRALKPANKFPLDSIESDIVDYRTSIYDQLNSLNYIDPSFEKFVMPPLLQKLGDKVLSELTTLLSKKTDVSFNDVKISYRFFKGNKLWTKTDVKDKTIYISPYLIRAAFTKSLENLQLFKIANQQLNLKSFFQLKGEYISYSELNDVYGKKAFKDYENTLRFILSHELFHIYLKAVKSTKSEQLCDCYALSLLKANLSTDLGVFESLIIKSIEEGATRFWGSSLKPNEIMERYDFLKKYKETNINLDNQLCDSFYLK